MKKYRKWILVLTALTVFYVVHVESLKATSLIHAGKFSKLLNTTSSSTTTALPTSSNEPSSDRLREILDELPDDDVIDVNGTKITLTGIPQIDYVWDPNLPRELNGYNLSTYPFLDSMPADEDIGFDCEDKKNGFYASIKYSCQLYHHCLYGVRSDFICANFTAFDQKTFICHFASEVDCKNSYKYWNRNDDLYKATTEKSTTTSSTIVPLFDRGFYNRTRHSFFNKDQNSNSNNNNNSPQASTAAPSQSNNDTPPNRSSQNSGSGDKNINRPNNYNDDLNHRPQRPLRRPLYRRRPVDYYYYDDEYADDFYDERMRRRNRPRNRRPVYDDYDSRRLDNRRPYYDDFDDYEYERRQARPRNRNEERRRGHEDRRGGGGERRRPLYDDNERIDERRRNADRRPQQFSEERKISSDNFDDRRGESRRKNNFDVDDKSVKHEESVSDEKLIKPQGTSIFDRARPPPKINRPVPLSEKNKYAYNKNTEKAAPAPIKEEDSYEYEDDYSSSTTTKSITTTKQYTAAVTSPKPFFQKLKPATVLTTTAKPTVTTVVQDVEYYEDEYYDTVTPTPKNFFSAVESTSIKPRDEQRDGNRVRYENFYSPTTTTASTASSPESFRLNRYKPNNGDISRDDSLLIADQSTKKPQQSIIASPNENGGISKKYANKQTVFDHVTQETPSKYAQEVPQQSYFQNLYNNRNLEVKHETGASINQHSEEKEQKVLSKIIKRPFIPSRGGNPYKARGLQPVGVLAQQSNDETLPASSERPKISLEDLYNEEYDVDLNDALNPMLKPLTSSRGIQQSAASDRKDSFKAQSQIVQHHEKVTKPAQRTTTTEAPEYYDDEFEYTYADEVA